MKKNPNNEEPVHLGTLTPPQCFHFPQRKTTYRLITYPPRKSYPKYGSVECYNLKTRKAEKIKCNRTVIPVH